MPVLLVPGRVPVLFAVLRQGGLVHHVLLLAPGRGETAALHRTAHTALVLGPGRHELLRVHGVQVPLETGNITGHTLLKYVCNPELLPFALQFLSELQSTCDVAKISQIVVDPVIVNLLEVVQPNLSQSHGVLLENIGARSPLVWRS